MNHLKPIIFLFTLSLLILSGCSNNSKTSVDLDQVLKIMASTLMNIENQAHNLSNDELMPEFEKQFHIDINQASPKLHSETIGIKLQDDASVIGYSDKNDNAIQDSGERLLFKVEIDQEGKRLLASEGQQVREHRAGSGFFTGFLIASMLGRQRTAGVNPRSLSSKKVTAKSTSHTNKSKSAKSSSKSGSFSKGK